VADGNVPAKRKRRPNINPWRKWTPAEDAKVRALYSLRTKDAALAALPGRTWQAIKCRALRLGKSSGRAWTAADDATLRNLWPDTAARTIREKLRRSWRAIDLRAVALGINSLRWAGYTSVSAAAEKHGYCGATLRRILGLYAAHFASLPLSATADLHSPATHVRRLGNAKVTHRVVDDQAALDAIEWWQAMESRPQAARRLGVPGRTLADVMHRAPDAPGYMERRPPAWWDALWAEHGVSLRPWRSVPR
jgi:hypothetical protein